jgi:hypothetical protein
VTPPIIIVVREREKRDGEFEAYHDGRYLLTSRSPFIDSARLFLAQGANPRARIIMRRSPDGIDALSGILGRVAGVEVAGVGFRRAQGPATPPPVRSGVVAGTTPAAAPSGALSAVDSP